MKLSKSIIRNLIKESIGQILSEETDAEQRDTAVNQIANILIRLEDTGLNAQDILNDAKEAYEKGKPKPEQEMSPSNRKEPWTDADHDKQEDIAQKLAKDNPDMPKDEKMAIAGAQVNREKRKRNK